MKNSVIFEEERFQELANFAPAMLWRINASFDRDWVNETWLEFTGGTLSEETGFGWIEKVHPDDRERVLEEFDTAFEAREAATVEFRLCRRDGTYRWMLDLGRPIYSDGNFAGYVGSCIDITDRKQAESKAQQLRAAILEFACTEAGSRFGDVLSAELRQPLQAINSYSDALVRMVEHRSDLPEAFNVGLASLKRATSRFTDVLDARRRLASTVPVDPVVTNLKDALAPVEQLVRLQPRCQGSTIVWNIEAGLKVRIVVSQIEYVLLNLCTRAVSHMTDDGTRTLFVTASRWGGAAIVSVSSVGPVASVEPSPEPDENFELTPGDGLGVSEMIVTSHGGRLWGDLNHDRVGVTKFTLPLL
jgi:PAS domain S-box-containing protein